VFVIISALILQFALAPVAGACTPPDEPFNIESLGVFGETTAPEAVDVVGTTAYVADDDGLSIYDVTDPAAASFLGDHAIVGGAMDVFVSGTVAYVGGEDGKVYIVDVTTPATPAPLDILNAGSPVVRLFAEGARLVVAADDGIHIYDVTDPSSPVADGFISTPEPVSDVLVDGDVLYAVYSYYTVSGVSVQCVPSNLMAIDISGGTPTELARHEIPYGHVSLGLYGDLLFVAISHPDGGGSGVKVFDVANPDELDFITYVGVASYGALDIAMDGAFVYLAGLKSTWLWHFNDLAVPYLAGLHTDPNYRLDFEGGYLFGTNPDVGVSVYGYTGESVRSLGASRYDTAIDVSKNFASADWVVIATGANYPDALAGAPLAYELGGPILLSHPKNGLSAAAKTEVDRLGATHALILGGTGVVPSVVSSQLAAAGVPAGNIARIAGTNRYDTSAKIAARLKAELGGGAVTEAFIATGENFPDALAASGLAAKMGAPVLLVQTGSIPSQTAGALAALGVTDTIVLGGTSAVSATVYNRLPSPMRLAGTNRFATAAAVASWALDGSGAGFAPDQVIVATGSNFPDALSSGVLGAAKSSATVLVNTDVPGETRNFLATRASGIDGLYVIGGPGAVSVEVERVCVSLIK
jgi:putative cell wall-binding protein